MDPKIETFFAELRNQDTSRLNGLRAAYRFVIDGAGDWFVIIADDQIKIHQDNPDAASADCTISVAADDFKNLIDGTLNTQMAFMSGQLLIEGDISLAFKLGLLL